MNKLIIAKFEFLLITAVFFVISFSFLSGLIISSGDVAQGDWSIPITANAAVSNFNSHLFVRSFNGFGVTGIEGWCFPFLPLLNVFLSSLGLVGGAEIKILAVFLVALGGITAYLLAKSLRLGRLSSVLAGLFFMSTAVVFNWLIFGWLYYLMAYALFPLMLFASKKFMETNDLRYALLNGLILSIATLQPTFILIYPLLGFLFILFESKGKLKFIKRGLTLTALSLTVWFLITISFFTSYNNAESLSFYFTGYLHGITAQFSNFYSFINPVRLWGSTFNYQFETYFPQTLIIFSFIPVVIAMLEVLLRSTDRRVLFFLGCYLPVFFAYYISNNMRYLVTNLPYGVIFEAPSIFLVPAGLSLAMLIGYANQTIPLSISRLQKIISLSKLKKFCFVIILILVVLAGVPWWTGQVSGEPIKGIPTKLNLYQIPQDYTIWNNNLNASHEYFVLYLPVSPNVQISGSEYFSEEYAGVNSAIFTMVNDLPYVSLSNSTLFLNELMNANSIISEQWGSFSIKYIVVFTNVNSAYNINDILGRLSAQNGIVKLATFPNVVVFEDKLAKPVVYGINCAETQILYQDPTRFKVQVNSSCPFTLVLNQAYSNGWRVWVNGSVLPDTAHSADSNGFNNWQINLSGNMNIDIYYEPQTIYLISKIIASGVLVVVLLYILIVSLRDIRRKLKK